MTDRRLSRRTPFRKRIKYGSTDDPGLVGYSFNISQSGIGIKANRVFRPRSRILIHIYVGGAALELGEDEIIRLEGIVAWTSHLLPGITPTMGVKILNSSDDIKHVCQ
jgi:hypothetical protein